MAKLITGTELKDAISNQTFIKHGKPENAEGIKYDFTLGSQVLKADPGQPIDISQLQETERTRLNIQPGEIVFVLTEEVIDLPGDIYALLIPKRKLAQLGILVLGGLSVDPLYSGKLLIGLYNFSSTRFPITRGKKLLGAQFYRLEEGETDQFKKPESTINGFPDDLVNIMSSYHPISLQSLESQFKDLEARFGLLQKDFEDKDVWFERFQQMLDKQEGKIEEILNAIKSEVVSRQGEDNKLESQIQKLAENVNSVTNAVGKQSTTQTILVTLIVGLFVAVLAILIGGFFNK